MSSTRAWSALQGLVAKWESCKAQTRDTIDVGRTDAPMATMMIGQTEDSFEAVDNDLRQMTQALVAKANALQSQLSMDAERNQQMVVWVSLLGLLISVVVALVISRSIVRPIRAITDVMQRLSAGEIEVEMKHGVRRDEIGQMADAIDVFRKNIIDKARVGQTLAEAIEAITEGVSLYDAEDRLRLQLALPGDVFPWPGFGHAGHELRAHRQCGGRASRDRWCRRWRRWWPGNTKAQSIKRQARHPCALLADVSEQVPNIEWVGRCGRQAAGRARYGTVIAGTKPATGVALERGEQTV
jgi:HAMP domain-containing protein